MSFMVVQQQCVPGGLKIVDKAVRCGIPRTSYKPESAGLKIVNKAVRCGGLCCLPCPA